MQVEGTSALMFTTLKKRGHWSGRWLSKNNKLARLINYGEICLNCIKLPQTSPIKRIPRYPRYYSFSKSSKSPRGD